MSRKHSYEVVMSDAKRPVFETPQDEYTFWRAHSRNNMAGCRVALILVSLKGEDAKARAEWDEVVERNMPCVVLCVHGAKLEASRPRMVGHPLVRAVLHHAEIGDEAVAAVRTACDMIE